MAYVSKEDKAKFAKLLKEAFGTDAKKRGFKYSLSVRHMSTIVLTISGGTIDFIGNYNATSKYPTTEGYVSVNTFHIDSSFSGTVKTLLLKIHDILNTDNHNNSDIMTDYFDVGHYIDINIGKWDKPYKKI